MSERDELVNLVCGATFNSLELGQERSIADAILAAGWRKVPPGWVVVPREPPHKVVIAVERALLAGKHAEAVWAAGIEAALAEGDGRPADGPAKAKNPPAG